MKPSIVASAESTFLGAKYNDDDYQVETSNNTSNGVMSYYVTPLYS